ncbi:MAG TPA: PIG-L deacetylase family protein, partial [Actinopolymorphaceae bacterium]
CVVAHPDDMEFGAAAAVARWTGQGKWVGYTMVTSGEAGIDGMSPEEAGPLREREEYASARIVGVDQVEFLGFPDGVLEYGLPLRRALAGAIRRHRPDVVITINFRESFEGGIPNQADHIAVGRALVDAIRDAGNRWVFRDLLQEDLLPWNGVRFLLSGGSSPATHGVDVSEYFDRGIESLKAHAAYLEGLGDGMGDPSEFLAQFAEQAGERLGCRYGVAFERIPFQF